jgi:Tfp pilus assembly protein PilO
MTKQKRKIYYLIAGVTVLAVIVLVFIIIPTVNRIKTLNTEIYNQRLDIETRYLLSHGPERNINIAKIKDDEEKLSSLFIKNGSELEFITSIENAAQANNLTQQIRLQPANAKITETIESVPMSVSLRGNFADILKYIQSLEKLNYYINISSINLNNPAAKKEIAEPNTTTPMALDAEISALTYWEN